MSKYKYEIAKIKIELDVFESKLIKTRMKAYESDFSCADVKITIIQSNEIKYNPEYKIIGASTFRGFGTKDGDYGIFDMLDSPENLSAVLYVDKTCSCVIGYVKDIENLGGASIDVRAFNMIGDAIKYASICREGFVFHSSTIRYNQKGILFSADSGTGKSTHTSLWKKYYPSQVDIINDDTPIIRFIDGIAYVFGTPWSGKSDINENISAPLSNIVFLERGETNSLVELDFQSAFKRFISQSFIMPFIPLYHAYLATAERVLRNVKMIILKCNISKDAVDTVKTFVEAKND